VPTTGSKTDSKGAFLAVATLPHGQIFSPTTEAYGSTSKTKIESYPQHASFKCLLAKQKHQFSPVFFCAWYTTPYRLLSLNLKRIAVLFSPIFLRGYSSSRKFQVEHGH